MLFPHSWDQKFIPPPRSVMSHRLRSSGQSWKTLFPFPPAAFLRAHARAGDNGTVTGTMLCCRARKWPCPITNLRESIGLNDPSSTCRSRPRLPWEHVCRYFEKKASKHFREYPLSRAKYTYIKNYERQKERGRSRSVMKMLGTI